MSAGSQTAHCSPDRFVRVLRRSAGRLRLAVMAADPDQSELERAVRAAPGVKAASFSVKTGNLLVTFDTKLTGDRDVLCAITSAVSAATTQPPEATTHPPEAATQPPGATTQPPEATTHPPEAATQPPGAIDPSRTPAASPDELAVRDIEVPDGWMAAEGTCLLRATPGDCVEAILDFTAYPDWQRYVTGVEILEHDNRGRGSVVRTEGSVGQQTVVHVMRYRYPSPTRIAWEQVEGELEAIRGEWRLRAAGRAATRATYRLEIRPGLRLRLLLRGPLYGQTRDMLFAHTLGELRTRVEGADAARPA